MRYLVTRLAIVGAIAVAGLGRQADAALVITEVMSQSAPSGSPTPGTGDWFEIQNTGPDAVDLSTYKMDDNSSTFTLSVALTGVGSVPAGGYAIFMESATAAAEAADVANFRTFWGGAATTATIGSYSGSGVGLGATGDAVNLFDAAGNNVAGVTFGATTTGTSFDYTFGSATPTNSVAGVHGAYTSASALGNVGSPGVSVPEPTSLAALALVAGATMMRRRPSRR